MICIDIKRLPESGSVGLLIDRSRRALEAELAEAVALNDAGEVEVALGANKMSTVTGTLSAAAAAKSPAVVNAKATAAFENRRAMSILLRFTFDARLAEPVAPAYFTVIASPLRSAFAISPTCRPESSRTAPFWLVSTIARTPAPTARPAPAAA